MKVVVAPLHELDHYVSREFAAVIRGLVADHGWRHLEAGALWNDPRPLRDKLRAHLGALPEVLLFWEVYGFIAAHTDEVERLNCLKAVVADDLPRNSRDRLRWNQLHAYLVCDLALSTYAYRFEDYFPEARRFAKVVWVPHAASPDFLLPLNKAPDPAVLLS